MIKADDSDDYDNVGEFNSFKFNVFKFPDEPSGMTLHKFNVGELSTTFVISFI